MGNMKRKTHSIEEKLLVVKRYLSGDTATSLEREFGIDHHDVVLYVNRYKRYGEEGLKRQVSKVTSRQEKIRACREYLNHSLSLHELADKYAVDRATIRTWVKMYLNDNMEGLRDKRHDKHPKKKMYKSSDEKANEHIKTLQEKVKDLEAENALLKKVKALVEKREAQRQETGSKPSKN